MKQRLQITRYQILLNILPILSIVLFAGLWILVSSGEGHIIPSPGEVYDRAVRLFEKPINHVSLGGHI